jgi:hypothetical protein
MDTVFSGLMVGGADDTSLQRIPLAANANRLALKLRPPSLFNRSKKGIHIGMKNSSHGAASELGKQMDRHSMIYPEMIDPRMGTK